MQKGANRLDDPHLILFAPMVADDAIYHYSIHDSVWMFKLLFGIPSQGIAGGNRLFTELTFFWHTKPLHLDSLSVCTHTADHVFPLHFWVVLVHDDSSSQRFQSMMTIQMVIAMDSSGFIVGTIFGSHYWSFCSSVADGICSNLESHSSRFHCDPVGKSDTDRFFRTKFLRPILFFFFG